MKYIVLALLLISCSTLKKENKAHGFKTPALVEKKVELSIKEYDVFNGKVKFINFTTSLESGTHKIKCREQGSNKPLIKNFLVSVEGGNASLYYAESYHSKAKKHFCFIEQKQILTINVKQFPYKKEFLKVARGKVVLSKKNKARAAREWHITQKIYQNSQKRLLISEPFKVPLDSFITSHYGKKRIFNNLKKSQHLGNDFRAKVGVPIPVSNRGKVVFVGNLFYTGNVVIVDHGLNLFTLYAHLSKTMIPLGTIVNKGDIVGLAGMTGRVSGPHLHWGVKLHGYNIDGFSLVTESKNQFIDNELAQ
jgi:murein DD-endopeptidase MepM/ murein hydrolase activator NlpD